MCMYLPAPYRQQLRARNAPQGVEIEHCTVQFEIVSNDRGNNIIVKRLESYLITIRRYIDRNMLIKCVASLNKTRPFLPHDIA